MKNLFAITLAILFSSSAFCGTDIIYGGTREESVVAGEIFFPSQKNVDVRNVCFDNHNHNYKSIIPAGFTETCSLAGLIITHCEEHGGRIIRTPKPARTITAPEVIITKNCIHWDQSNSYQPSCTEYETIEKRQPIDFTFMKYKVAIEPLHYMDPTKYEIRNMPFCN